MINPIIRKVCTECGVEKRTTNDDEPYICEEDLKEAGRTTYNSSSSMKEFVYLVIVFIAGLLLGSWLF